MSLAIKIARRLRIIIKRKRDTNIQPLKFDRRLKRQRAEEKRVAKERSDMIAATEAQDGAGLVVLYIPCWCFGRSCSIPCECR